MARARPRLLLVEDDAALRAAVRDRLSEDFDPVEAGTCAEARAAMAAKPCALGLFDHDLPDGDGLGLLRELRAAHTGFRVVLFTGRSPGLPPGAPLPPGLHEVLRKPNDFSRLGEALRELANAPPA